MKTKKQKLSLILISVLLSAMLLLSACKQPSLTKEPAPETATEVSPVKQTSPETSGTRAQDDFYDYVNASFIKEKANATEGEVWDNFADLQDKLSDSLQDIVDELSADGAKFADNSAEKAVADLYKSALDSNSKEKAGLGSLKPYLDAIENAETIPAYLDALAKVYKDLGKNSLFSFLIAPNPNDASTHAAFIEESAMLLDKPDFEDEQAVDALNTYITDLLTAKGTKSEDAQSLAEKLLNFNKDLADVALSKTDRANVKMTMNIMDTKTLTSKLSNIDLPYFLSKSGLESYKDWVVQNPAMLDFLNKSLSAENLEVLKAFSTVALLNDFAPFLSKAFADANAKFNQLEGIDESAQAWEATNTLAEKEVGELYAKKFFSAEKKAKAEAFVRTILEAYKKNLQSLTWMSEASRAEAIKKIDSMMVKVGYPESFTSFAKGMVKSPEDGGSLIENAIAIHKAKATAEQAKATAPVDKTVWALSPQTINAYYEPSLNEIIFPAAMLQPPFYDENASLAQNLGGIGTIIAHEITHAFDDMGSLFDDKGNFRDWWTKEDRQAFTERAAKFVSYFGGIEVLPGQKLDGELTLGENIADSGSLSVITSILRDDKEALKEMLTSYARIWAAVTTEDDILGQLASDEHAPAKVRVNGVLSVTDAFYEAFDLKPGDKMYVAPENRVKLF